MDEIRDIRPEAPPFAASERSVLGSHIAWGPAFGGGLVAAAVFFVLITFATAIGLAVSSVSPTWRDTSVGLVVLSGAWVVLTAVGSFALGGYLAGRVRSPWQASADEVHFRDGAHGLLVWSIAVIIGVGSPGQVPRQLTSRAREPMSQVPRLARTRPAPNQVS